MDIPRVIVSPATGGELRFLALPEETGGEYLQFELTAKPNTRDPPTHYHPTASEQFEVHEGSLTITVEGTEHALGPGDRLVIPARTPHSFRVGPEGVRGVGTVSPPGRFAEFLVSEYALMNAGKLGNRTEGDLLAVAPWIHEFRDVSRPVGPITYVFRALAPVGRALGNPSMPEYPVETVRDAKKIA